MNVNQSLYQSIKDASNLYPDRNALLFMGKYMTYHQMISKIDLISENLKQLGLKSKDVVSMAMPNVFEAIFVFYAVNKIGAICHMVHPLTPVNQMKKFMEKTGSKMLFILESFFEHYQDLLAIEDVHFFLINPTQEFGLIKRFGYKLINAKKLKHVKYTNQVHRFKELYHLLPETETMTHDAKDSSVYLHSGGTSGEPKTIALSDFAINTLASKTIFILGEDDFEDRHMLAVLPMFHGFGLCMGVHAMISLGGVNTLMPKFNAYEAIDLIKKNQINYLIGVPSLFENLISKPEIRGTHLQNVKQVFVGGDYVSIDLKHRFDRLMKEYGSKARMLEGYGLTECVTVCAVNTLKQHLQTSVGKPLPGLLIDVVDLETRKFVEREQFGEICVSGDTLMNGYLENENEIFFEDESGRRWIYTGDYGYIDQTGYVHFKQRLKRIVKVSGIPVLPSEIESLVSQMDEVKEVCAIGVPDIDKGNIIKLFLSLNKHENQETISASIKQRIKEELSIYAVPKEIVFLETLPKTIIGKIDARKLETM